MVPRAKLRRKAQRSSHEKADEATSESAEPAVEASKKRRGRPRKADSEVSSAVAAPAVDAATETSAEKQTAKPKRTTRRAKSAASADKAVDEAVAEKPARRTRRKASVSASEGEEGVQSDKKDQAEEAPKTRKRPGRSTKLRAVVEASEKEAAHSDDSRNGERENTASERAASDESGAEERTERRRAARPRKSVQIDTSSNDDSAAEGDASSNEGESKADGNAQRYQKRDRGQRAERNDRQSKGDRDSRNGRDNRSERSDRNGKNQRDNRDSRNGRNDRNDRHNRRDRNNRRDQYAPKTNIDDLSALRVAELREKAAEFEIEITAGMKKAELVDKVFEASVRAEGFIEVTGILDIMQDGYGFLRTKGYLPSEQDVYIGTSVIRRNNLRKGDMVNGQTRPARENEKYAALQTVISVNGIAPEEQGRRVKFADLTPIFPDEPLTMEHGHSTITARVIDLVSPIGKGQRGLIVSPPKAGKTTVLKDIAAAITANNPSVHLMCLLVDERPEEVTDMQRSIAGEVIASTFDMPTEDHIKFPSSSSSVRNAWWKWGKTSLFCLTASRASRVPTTWQRPRVAAFCRAASTPRRCILRSDSLAQLAISRAAAASLFWLPRLSRQARRWTRSFSRSSRARATWSSSSTARWLTDAFSRQSTRLQAARVAKICCLTPRRLRSFGRCVVFSRI